jgi:hypothetical protein
MTVGRTAPNGPTSVKTIDHLLVEALCFYDQTILLLPPIKSPLLV